MEETGKWAHSEQIFDRIFHPKNVAIVGVSPKGAGFGGGILSSLSAIGFSGEIYPVNQRGGQLNSRKIFQSLDEIPQQVDFAIIAVPAEHVPETLEKCRVMGVAGA